MIADDPAHFVPIADTTLPDIDDLQARLADGSPMIQAMLDANVHGAYRVGVPAPSVNAPQRLESPAATPTPRAADAYVDTPISGIRFVESSFASTQFFEVYGQFSADTRLQLTCGGVPVAFDSVYASQSQINIRVRVGADAPERQCRLQVEGSSGVADLQLQPGHPFRPRPDFFVTGVARDSDGRPLSGVTMEVTTPSYPSLMTAVFGTAVTDADGRFVIPVYVDRPGCNANPFIPCLDGIALAQLTARSGSRANAAPLAGALRTEWRNRFVDGIDRSGLNTGWFIPTDDLRVDLIPTGDAE